VCLRIGVSTGPMRLMGLMGLTGPKGLGSPAQALAWVFGFTIRRSEGPQKPHQPREVSEKPLSRPDLSPSQNPPHYGKNNADENAGSERKVESEIALLDGNISWQVSEPAKPGGKFPK
jgi:hypothetical protein